MTEYYLPQVNYCIVYSYTRFSIQYTRRETQRPVRSSSERTMALSQEHHPSLTKVLRIAGVRIGHATARTGPTFQ